MFDESDIFWGAGSKLCLGGVLSNLGARKRLDNRAQLERVFSRFVSRACGAATPGNRSAKILRGQCRLRQRRRRVFTWTCTLHRLPLPGHIAQAANIGAVIRNFRSRTARTSRPSPTSNPENNIPFDLLHGVQYQQLWLGQRPLHNINGLAHNPNIANSSSLHRKRKNRFKRNSPRIKGDELYVKSRKLL
jgi:hypothetical protein